VALWCALKEEEVEEEKKGEEQVDDGWDSEAQVPEARVDDGEDSACRARRVRTSAAVSVATIEGVAQAASLLTSTTRLLPAAAS
jgi:hypothetical protein